MRRNPNSGGARCWAKFDRARHAPIKAGMRYNAFIPGGTDAQIAGGDGCDHSRPVMDRHGRRAELSGASDHHDRAVPRRRRHRHAGASPGREHAADPGPAHHHRERRGRSRQYRRRPRRAFAGRRLHALDRHLDHAYADRRALRAVLRPVEGSRAGHPDRQRAALDRRQEEPAGGRSEGAGRLAQGQSRQGVGGHRRRRRDRSSHRVYRSRRRPARNSSSCRIAAMRRRCRICWRDRSTS